MDVNGPRRKRDSRAAEGREIRTSSGPRTEPETTLSGGFEAGKTFRHEGRPAQDVRAAVIREGLPPWIA